MLAVVINKAQKRVNLYSESTQRCEGDHTHRCSLGMTEFDPTADNNCSSLHRQRKIRK